MYAYNRILILFNSDFGALQIIYVLTYSEISVTETITETEIIDPTLTETKTEMMVILKTEIL